MTGQKGRSGGGGRNAGLPPGYWEAQGGRKAAAAAKKERLAAEKQRALSVRFAAAGFKRAAPAAEPAEQQTGAPAADVQRRRVEATPPSVSRLPAYAIVSRVLTLRISQRRN